MPDFNFAKGSRKKNADTTEPAKRPAPPLSGSEADPSHSKARSSSGPAAGGSVLDKYPKQDFSRLTNQPGAGSSDRFEADESLLAEEPPAEPTDTDEASDTISDSSTTGNTVARKPASRSGMGTMIAMISIVLFLLAVAFIWFMNPYPPLKQAIEKVFASGAVPDTVTAPPAADSSVAVPAEEVLLQSWDYFIQVSSWRALPKAEQDASRFRGKGMDVTIESEFLQSRRATYYRVRIGPFSTRDDAASYRAANPGLVPQEAFIDSVRTEDDQKELVVKKSSGPVPRRDENGEQESPQYDIRIMNEPLQGFAVKVSSFKSVGVARTEAQHLLAQGFPAFLTTTDIGGETWYRVMVGPFSDKRDADKYTRLINVTYGNDAYTVDLATP